MALMRWDPFRELEAIRGRMGRLFEEAFPELARHEGRAREEWTPPVDIFQSENAIVVRAEIPGVDLEDVRVEVKGDILTFQGERKLDEKIRREAYSRIERPYGSFGRSFTLPREVDQRKIQARLKDGVLEIVLPIPSEPTFRAVQVKVE